MVALSERTRRELASVRETVESIWVAIVLAFVLRAFVVEAFVIPTGSMAPRLYGQHLDLQCRDCGYEYAFDWKERRWGGAGAPSGVFTHSRCPNCNYRQARQELVAGGDRVLVMKYLYRFREPAPWDVVVFKNPQDNRQNYIKRLIGLPGETIEIVHGDIFVSPDDGKTFRIRRKTDRRVQRAMWHLVFDNDYRPARPAMRTGTAGFDGLEYPVWAPADEDANAAWKLDELGGRGFRFRGATAPAGLELQPAAETFNPRYGYNSAFETGRDVISDLKLEVTYIPEAPDSRLALTLTSFEYAFRGEVACGGEVRLLGRWEADGPEGTWHPLATERRLPPLRPGRGYRVALAHVDLQVVLSIDGEPVLVSRDRQDDTPPEDREHYPLDYALLKRRVEGADGKDPAPVPTPQVGISAVGGPCRLRHVRLLRDVFYTSPRINWQLPNLLDRRQNETEIPNPNYDFARSLPAALKHTVGWGTGSRPIHLRRFPDRPDLDQFFVLGDNSPSSLDGRLWVSAAPTLRLYDNGGPGGSRRRVYQLGTVPRYNLIGKAVFVYWPSGFRAPIFSKLRILPNVGKMRLIR